LERLSFLNANVGTWQAVMSWCDNLAADRTLHLQRSGDMVGMDVRINGVSQLQSESVNLSQVPVHAGNDRVYEKSLSSLFIAQKIGVRA
jgi:hypothetical protein